MYYRQINVFLTLLLTTFISWMPSANAQSLVSKTNSSNLTKTDPRVPILEAQLELMRQYDARLLSTVDGSINILLVLVALFVGANWVVNFFMYRRDKASLQQELRRLVQEEINTVKNEADEHYKILSGNLRSEIDNKLRDEFIAIDDKLKDVQLYLKRLDYSINVLDSQKERLPYFKFESCIKAAQLAHDLNLGFNTLSPRLYEAKLALEEAVKSKEDNPAGFHITINHDDKESFRNLLDSFPTSHKKVVDILKSLLQRLYE